MTGRDPAELYAHWAIVTVDVASGASHPTGVWGPYTRWEAECVVKTIAPGHNPHIVPFWTRSIEFDIPRKPKRDR